MLKIYMGYDSFAGSEEGACLVFAHNRKEARKIAFPVLQGWFDSQWIDCTVQWLKDGNQLYSQADQEKLKKDEAHVIESPQCCRNCDLWGEKLNEDGYCEKCAEDKNWNQLE